MAKRGGFPGCMPGNMNNLMKQAQKMQKQMAETTKALEEKTYEATAGGGVVSVTVSGKKEVTAIKIAEEVVDPDDIEMLEDLIMAATCEIELIHTTAKALLNIGINNFKVKINDRRILREILLSVGFEEEQLDSVCISFDKLNKIKAEGVEAELIEKGFDKDVIAEFMKLLANAPFTLDYVKEICKDNEYVASLAHIIDTSNALADGKYTAEYDMTLVRGQGYYTGTVFEVESLDFNSSIAGGGRYDNLIGKFLKEQIPAVGFSIGFERIYSILMEKEAYKTEKQKKVVLIYEEDQIADAIRYAENLRKTYKTALYIKPKKLGKFLNKLEEQGFDGFQVFGRDEEVRMFGK